MTHRCAKCCAPSTDWICHRCASLVVLPALRWRARQLAERLARVVAQIAELETAEVPA